MTALNHLYSCAPGFLFPNLEFQDRLDAVAATGIQRVELWARTDRYADLHPECDHPEKIRAALSQRGLSVSSLGAHTSRGRAEVEKALLLAAKIGAEIVVIGSKVDSLPGFLENLSKSEDLAENLGVRIAVFNHVKGLVQTRREMAILCSDTDAGFAGLSLAPPHAAILGEEPSELISTLGSRILQVWLWDLLPGVPNPAEWMEIVYTRGDEQFPGAGALPFADYLSSLLRLGLAPQLNFVPHGVQDWPAERTVEALRGSLEWLESMVDLQDGSGEGLG